MAHELSAYSNMCGGHAGSNQEIYEASELAKHSGKNNPEEFFTPRFVTSRFIYQRVWLQHTCNGHFLCCFSFVLAHAPQIPSRKDTCTPRDLHNYIKSIVPERDVPPTKFVEERGST